MSRRANKLNTQQRDKKKYLKMGLLITLAILLFLTGFGYAYVQNLLNSTQKEEITQSEDELGIGDKDFEFDYNDAEIPDDPDGEDLGGADLPFYYKDVEGITNIALFGIDAPLGQRGRSDAIMLVTIDRNNKKIKLTSLIRDSYVSIPGRGMDKINHAYAFGGPELAIRTINSNFHLDIKNFASVNFTTLPQIIDILGGVNITLSSAEASQVPGASAGANTLNGAQALAYSRIRKIDSDFARSERQRTVMEAAIKKMLNQPLSSYPNVLSKILPLVTTNMNANDILGISGSVVTNGIRTVEQHRFPEDAYSSGQMIQGVYYYVFNRDRAVHSIGRYLYLDERRR